MSIPKKIHYCWFGKQPYPEKVEKCIASWKEHLVDYELVKWDESNSPMELPFVKKAYKKELWAFVSDYVRLKVLYEQGGIYLDTDMLVVKSIDDLLDTQCFFGSESDEIISCGIIAVVKEHPLIKEVLGLYDNLIISKHYELEKISIPQLITKTFALRYNYNGNFRNEVKFEDIIIYPKNYFYSFPNNMHVDQDFNRYIDESTYMMHLWAKSWKEVSEFTLIKRKQYFKAFKKMMQMVIKHKIVSLAYYKRIYRFYKQSRTK